MSTSFKPVTPSRWKDFEKLFGKAGACAGCWCMVWRLPHAEYQKNKYAGNKRRMKRIIESGAVPGILAYVDGEPAGWVSVAPREEFFFLERSRVLKPVDDKKVWSISCLFVLRPYRNRGLSVRLLREAVKYARKKGARIVEGYPTDPRKKEQPPAFVWTGLLPGFQRAGFREVARRSPIRPIMRVGR